MENIINAVLKMLENKSIDAEGALSLLNEVRTAYSQTICESTSVKSELPCDNDNKVAVIGIALRFPGADNPEEFWQRLEEGADCITEFPKERYPFEEFYSENLQQSGKSYSKWGGFIENIKEFPTGFFKIDKEEAKYIDPQQRIFLEIACEAFQTAGYSKKKLSGTKTGVIVGARKSGYDTSEDEIGSPKSITGSITNFIATRVSDYFNLKGSSLAIDTACSSSLVAIHYACNMLKNQECDMALAGGIDLKITPVPYVTLSDAKALSQSGRCYAFDKRADGFVPGEGGGAVLLKPLNKALLEGDFIYAVISGSEVNNDGHTMGITTPNFEGQKELLRQAYKKAKVHPMEVSYMEAHGTGTLIGDPIEIKALSEFYKEYTDRKSFCAIGSVKTNIGHLDTAAGIAGFIKAVLSLYYKKLVPTLHCDTPNPRLNLVSSPFYPVTALTDFRPIGKIRRAAVSSFGFGGTNCHVIMEENSSMPKEDIDAKEEGDYLLTLSAENALNLSKLSYLYRKILETNPAIQLKNFCYTANTAREFLPFRAAFYIKNKKEAIDKLKFAENPENNDGSQYGVCTEEERENVTPSVAMVFPGQGSQYSHMAKRLYHTLPEFKKAFDLCDGYAFPHLKVSLKEVIFQKEKEELLNQTCFTQPALFTICYGLAQVFLKCGVKPKVVLGHSVGEFVAACIAGILTLKDAIALVCMRGALIQKLPQTGSMLIAREQYSKIEEIIQELTEEEKKQISIAAINSPSNTVVSGDNQVIDSMVLLLQSRLVRCTKLNVSHAFHSLLMEPILQEYMQMLNNLSFHPVNIPFICNVTGELLRKGTLDKEYMGRHLIQRVMFEKSIETALSIGVNIFLEVGPGTTASSMMKDIIRDKNGTHILHTLDRKNDDVATIYRAAAKLFTRGVNIEFQNLEYRKVRTERIPTCPLVKETCWIEQHRSVRLKQVKTNEEIIESISKNNPLLEDHIVKQNKIFPGAALWEVVMRNATLQYKRKVTGLKQIKHISQLALTTGNQLHIKINYEKETSGNFKVLYCTDLKKDWKLCASGTIDFEQHAAEEYLDVEGLIREFKESDYTVKELYNQFSQKGVDYGDTFQSIEKVWTKDNQVIAKLKIPERMNDKEHLYHPGFVDGGLQSIIGLKQESQKDAYIPFFVNQVRMQQPLPCEGYSVLTMTGNSKEVLTVDVVITDMAGNVNLRITKHAFKKIREKTSTSTSLSEIMGKGYFYIPKYIEKPTDIMGSKESYSVVLFGDNDTSIQRIIKGFHAHTVPVICCCKGKDYKEMNGQTVEMDFQSASHYTLLFDKVKGEGFQNIKIINLLPKTYVSDISRERDKYFTCSEEVLADFTRLLQAIEKIPNNNVTEIISVSVEDSGNASMFDTTKSVIAGFMKSAQREYVNIRFKLLQADTTEGLYEYIIKEINNKDTDSMIQYLGGRRKVQSLEPVQKSQYLIEGIEIKKDGTYIITGGLHGIGFQLAEYISEKYGADLILISRSSFPDKSTWQKVLEKTAEQDETAMRIRALQKMNRNGSWIDIINLDVSKEAQIETLCDQLLTKRHVDGIFHLAGVLRDSLIKNKFIADIGKVCAPKIRGSIHITEAFKSFNPSFIILFSSIASFFGSVGQADYAAANGFMDDYADYITTNLGIKAIAINWTMWDSVGMGARSGQVDAKKSIGLTPYSIEGGFEALEQILKLSVSQVIAFNNPIEALKASVEEKDTKGEREEKLEAGSVDREELELALEKELTEKVAEILDVGTEDINSSVNFMELGLDSVSIVDFTTWVGERIKEELYPTLLFEYSTIKELTAYLLENHWESFGTPRNSKPVTATDGTTAQVTYTAADVKSMEVYKENTVKMDTVKEKKSKKEIVIDEKSKEEIIKEDTAALESTDIAIIGFSGMFPGAKDTDRYWENLKCGINSITTPPLSRFPDASKADILGGFLEGVDLFDPLFFNISPTETVFIDPQQRLFLESVFKTLDMAGYSQRRLKHKKVGVYVGASQVEYKKLCENSGITSPYMGLGNSLCVIANRVSYLLNLKGPSMAVDSACSSSLVALEIACRAIQNKEVDMAVAGGVQLYFTTDSFQVFKAAGMLSSEGKCKTFDAAADGYVRGEGVGAVLLKPYDKAVSEGDLIYAVIKGIAVNHDGNDKVGISAPNPNGQKEVILEAIKKAGIHPEDISYFEAHGTGTALGDPVEIRGLSQAYGAYTNKKSFCAISTAKTSIGHLEACAGMAGLIKTILMFQHKELPKSLHFNKQNPHIPFISSPFYINDKLKHWDSNSKKRYAAVSSFGFGGTNCHVVLSEHIQEIKEIVREDEKKPQVLALSARSQGALEEMIKDFFRFVKKNSYVSLKDICYSLNTGRDMYEYKACFVAESLPVLKEKLERTVQKGIKSMADSQYIMYGDNSSKSERFAVMLNQEVHNHNKQGELKSLKDFDVFLLCNEVEEIISQITGKSLEELINQEQYSWDWLSFITGYIKIKTLKQLGLEPSVYIVSESQKLLASVLTDTTTLIEAITILHHQEQACITLNLKKTVIMEDGRLQGASMGYLRDRQIENVFVFNENMIHINTKPLEDTFIKLWDTTSYTLSHMAALAFTLGYELDWLAYYRNETCNRVVLPAYPFQKKSYFIPSTKQKEAQSMEESRRKEELSGKKDTEEVLMGVEMELLSDNKQDSSKSKYKMQPHKSYQDMTLLLTGILSKLLTLKEEEVNIHLDFRNYGLDSLLIADAVKAIEENLHIALPHSIFMEYKTVEELSGYLSENYGKPVPDDIKPINVPIHKNQEEQRTIKERRMVILKEVAEGVTNKTVALNALLHLEGGERQC
ncbi:type I polyketide synthase [Anaerocolumna cellulosilytica]|nr:type I polyketide synthase [Anaerocolumna cellulosilytica]MBB5196462.1 acyl transferase domain-containing protein/NAD(P)-dependent dehydrogenase (short-subunit alcohol dehydrogenase family)/aryl carrier-like protein [Anaerocolumna cellulosilytica]